MSDLGRSAVAAVVQSTPSAFTAEDFEPRPLSTVKRRQRRNSVFLNGTDWASPSSTTILDALHDRAASDAANCDRAKTQLPFLRNAGSMMLEGTDADLVEAENVRGKTSRATQRLQVYECKHCHRIVLSSRFLMHLQQCPKYPGRGDGPSNPSMRKVADAHALDDADDELNLVTAPYKEKRSDFSNPLSSFIDEDGMVTESMVTVEVLTLPYFSGTAKHAGALKKRGSHWQKRLTPLRPVCKARGGRLRQRHKAALETLADVSLPKKKQNTAEKRALTAAASVGLGSCDSNDEDMLQFAGGDWGLSAQWGKLIQMCRPIVVPRSELRKNLQTRESPLSLFVKAPGGGGNQFLLADSVTSKMLPRSSNTRITKAMSRHLPSLPGALLHIRGKYLKKLQNTVLGRLDTSSSTIPKTIYMYHGQSFFANPGQFFSDHRSPSEVVLPTSVVDPSGSLLNARPGAPARITPQQAQALAAQRASGGSSGGPSPMHEPPTKKQRVSSTKARAMQPHSAIPNAAVPPKQPIQRKLPAQRAHLTKALPNSKAMAARMTQLAQQRHATLNNAAALNRAQAQPTQPKRPYRSPNAPIPPSAISPLDAQLNAANRAPPAQPKAPLRHQNMLPLSQPQNIPLLNAFQRPTDRNTNARLSAQYEALLRATNPASASGPQHAFSRDMQHRKKQPTAPKVNPALSIHDLERRSHAQAQAQLVQQLGATPQAQLHNFSRASQQRFNPAQVRATAPAAAAATTSAALGARAAAAAAAQMFSNPQLTARMNPAVQNLYNPGFPMPPAHDRAQNVPTTPNTLAFLQLMQSNPQAAAQLSGRAGMGLQEMRAVQGFAPVPNNVLNYYQAAASAPAAVGNDANLTQHSRAALAAKLMANRNALVSRMMPNDPLLSQFLPASQNPNLMGMPMQPAHPAAAAPPNVPIAGAAAHLMGASAAAVNGAQSASQALSDIDKALMLGDLKE